MASSKASIIVLNEVYTKVDTTAEIPFEYSEKNPPKQTSVDKIGGILCCICALKFGNKKDFIDHYATHNTGETVFTCVACNKPHSNYASFRNHCYLQHIVRDKFGCQLCNKRFSKQSILTAHITAIHEFKCGDCNEIFTTKKDLHVHKITHNRKGKEEPPYNCKKCSDVINNIDMCESHMDIHCEIMYPCPICGKILPSLRDALMHLGSHFDEEFDPDTVEIIPFFKEDSSIETLGGILCCHCDLLCKNRLELESHFQSYHEERDFVYTCNICEKPFTSYTLFGDHCYRHIAKGSFHCDQCENIFSCLSVLVKHNLVFHSKGSTDKPYKCDKCDHAFKSFYRLMEHKRVLHDEDSIKCNVSGCSAIMNSSKQLVEHLHDHKSCLDNWCLLCGLQFATRAACASHLHVHRRKRYECPVCARTYAERQLLIKHLPRHFETVLHICKICGRSYNKRNRLMEHSKIHSDIKNKYQCTYCSKAFLRAYQLEQHQRIHTGVKPYRCTVCFRTFASYPNWTKHLTRVHSYDKDMIKEAREKIHQTTDQSAPKLSPAKTESGIESAGSELSDRYGFLESDDSESDGPVKKIKREFNSNNNVNSANDKKEGSAITSITDTVNAVIDRIDSMNDLDMIAKDLNNFTDFKDTEHTVFTSDFTDYNSMNIDYNDSSEIKAIVEHIDALSGGLEMEATSEAAAACERMMQFQDMMPVENIAFDSVPAYSTLLPESTVEYYQTASVPLEYGPDFTTLSSETFPDVMNLNDDVLPHIDPLLTIKAEQNDTILVENPSYNVTTSEQNWEQPIITKLLSYDDTNDANRMFALNGDIF